MFNLRRRKILPHESLSLVLSSWIREELSTLMLFFSALHLTFGVCSARANSFRAHTVAQTACRDPDRFSDNFLMGVAALDV
jgi:hypothetical protein